MKIGFRTPSIGERISARTSPKRYVRQNMGVKVPKGDGLLINPKKAAYNRVYNRTSAGCLLYVIIGIGAIISLILLK